MLAAGPGCGGDDGADSPPLERTEWTLVSGVDAPDDAVPTLLLDAGNASGFGGCNRFAGGYELDGTRSRSARSPAPGWRAPSRRWRPSSPYTQALESADAWAVEGGELVLSSGGAEILRYAPTAS